MYKVDQWEPSEVEAYLLVTESQYRLNSAPKTIPSQLLEDGTLRTYIHREGHNTRPVVRIKKKTNVLHNIVLHLSYNPSTRNDISCQ